MTDAEQKRLAALHEARIERVRDVMRTYDAGGISSSKALSEIESIASGDADRIVRVGTQNHTPEVQS